MRTQLSTQLSTRTLFNARPMDFFIEADDPSSDLSSDFSSDFSVDGEALAVDTLHCSKRAAIVASIEAIDAEQALDDRTMLQNRPDLSTLSIVLHRGLDGLERTPLTPAETIVRPHLNAPPAGVPLTAEWLRGVRGVPEVGAEGGGESKTAAAEDEDEDTANDEPTCAICYVPHAAGDLIETCASNTQRMQVALQDGDLSGYQMAVNAIREGDDGAHRVCRECLSMYVEHSLGNTMVRRAFKCPDYGCDAELREEAVRRRVYLCNYIQCTRRDSHVYTLINEKLHRVCVYR